MNLHDAIPREPDILEYLRLIFTEEHHHHWKWDGDKITYRHGESEDQYSDVQGVDFWLNLYGPGMHRWHENRRPPLDPY